VVVVGGAVEEHEKQQKSRAEQQQQQLGGCEGAGADEHAENSWMPLGKIVWVG
jgi:hypothetical protein